MRFDGASGEARNAPELLFLEGRLDAYESGRRISVVGSRRPTPEGRARAHVLAVALVQHGIAVVSGLAEGIDTSAHLAAMGAGGRTVAVLGTPLDEAYPPANRELQQRIMREHLALSQFAPGTPAQRGNFPRRNRTMALLSDATIIVEAGESSGTLHQGWEALRLGRPLFLLESITKDSRLSWPEDMLRYGAQVLTRENLAAALESVPERVRGEVAF